MGCGASGSSVHLSGQVVVGLLRTFSTLLIQMIAPRGAAREIGLECATARSVRVMITCFLFFNHPLALSICTAPAKRVHRRAAAAAARHKMKSTMLWGFTVFFRGFRRSSPCNNAIRGKRRTGPSAFTRTVGRKKGRCVASSRWCSITRFQTILPAEPITVSHLTNCKLAPSPSKHGTQFSYL